MRRSTILALLLLVIIAQPCLSGWDVTRVHPVDADWSQLESISGRYASGRIEYTNGPPGVLAQAALYDVKTNTWSALDARDTYAKANSTQWAAGYLYTDDGLGNYRFDATAWPIGGGPARILTPTGSIGSDAFAVSGSMVAGWSESAGKRHAYVWDLVTGQQYDLHPAAAVSGSSVSGLDGNRAAGTLGLGGGVTHAVLWNDVATDHYVDLNPPAATGGSTAWDVSGNSQAGKVDFLGAALWHGSAESYVRLHPAHIANAGNSVAYAVDRHVQAGFVEYDLGPGHFLRFESHATVWFGTAESMFDLHSLLDPAYYRGSVANDVWVDEIGNIYVVGYGGVVNGGPAEALLWTYLVPEPGPLAALALGLAGLPVWLRRMIACKLHLRAKRNACKLNLPSFYPAGMANLRQRVGLRQA